MSEETADKKKKKTTSWTQVLSNGGFLPDRKPGNGSPVSKTEVGDNIQKSAVVTKKTVEVDESFLPDWMRATNNETVAESAPETSGTAKKRAWQPVLPEPFNYYAGEGLDVGDESDISFDIAMGYMVRLHRNILWGFEGIDNVFNDYFALGTLLGMLGLERYVFGEPDDADRKPLLKAVYRAMERSTAIAHPHAKKEGVRENIAGMRSEYDKIFGKQIALLEEGFETYFSLKPSEMRTFIGFVLDDLDLTDGSGEPISTHRCMANMGRALGYTSPIRTRSGKKAADVNMMSLFTKRLNKHGLANVYSSLFHMSDEELQRVYEFEIPMGCSSISRIPDEYSEVRDTIARSVFEVVKRKLPSGTVYSGWSSDRRNLNGFYIDFEMPGAAGTRRLRLRYSSGVGQNEYRMVEYKGKISLK